MTTSALRVDDLRRHGRWLYRLARDIVRDDELARDLVQDTWLAAMRSPPPAEDKLQPWLGGVMRNLARMSFRSAVRRRGREQACADRDGAEPSPRETLERFEAELLLCEEVRRLEEPYRITLVLLYVEGLSAAEVARRLQISDSTVRWRHRHALGQLRRELAVRDPQRRRLRALLLPIGAAAVVQGGIEILRSKSLWAALLALVLAMTPWRGGAPAALQRSSVVGATSGETAMEVLALPAPAAPPEVAPAGPGELLVLVTDLTDAPIASAHASIDDLVVGFTGSDGRVVVAAEARPLLPESGSIAIDAEGYDPAAVDFQLGQPVHVRLTEPQVELAAPPPPRPDAPAERRRERADEPAGDRAPAWTAPASGAPALHLPPRRNPCRGGHFSPDLTRITKELHMMQRYVGPQVVIAALVGALHQSGCAVDDGGAGSGSRRAADVQSDDATGHGGDDPGEHPGDDGHDGGDGGDGDGDGGDGGDDGDDGGDGGETCPLDVCEGSSGTNLYFAIGCDDTQLIDVSIEYTCAEARERCEQFAEEQPDRNIYCEWGDGEEAEIFRREIEPGICDSLFGPPPEGPCEPPGPPHCDIPCGDDGPGTYSGFYCGPDGEPFVQTEGIDCQAALGDCALRAALDPTKDIVCEFNGEEIFRREVNEGSCVPEHGEPTAACDIPLPTVCEGSHPCDSEENSRYEGSFCDGRWFIRSRNIDCRTALGNCMLNASLDLTRSIRCQWNEQEIYRNEVEEGVCEEFGPTCDLLSP